MGSRQFSNASRIFTLVGKSLSMEEQKRKNDVFQNDRDEQRQLRMNKNDQQHQNDAHKLNASSTQTINLRNCVSPNTKRCAFNPFNRFRGHPNDDRHGNNIVNDNNFNYSSRFKPNADRN